MKNVHAVPLTGIYYLLLFQELPPAPPEAKEAPTQSCMMIVSKKYEHLNGSYSTVVDPLCFY